MFHSATVRLTAWYLCVTMAISLLFSAVVYRIGANDIAHSVHSQYVKIYHQFPVFGGTPLLKPNSDIDTGDHILLLRLVFLNIVILLLAGLASYYLARRTLQPIEEAHEQQKRFTSDVSHELRTPLTALKMESEVALMNPDISKKELKDTLKSNLEEATKLERLINNILRLSRLEADELRQNFGSLSTKKLVNSALEQVESQAKLNNITIEQDVNDLAFAGDEDGLTQLLVILIDNAIKYSKPASTVKVEANQVDDQLIIKIIDHGIGISSSSLEHIFDRFYRAEDSRSKEDQEGYGLGLSIAKMIADIHSAFITVSSKENKGTTVEVSFPLKSS